jgi:hypothetical protein
MHRSAAMFRAGTARASLRGVTIIAALSLAGLAANAADRAGYPSHAPRGGASSQFRETRDFYDIASRTDARFAAEAGATAATTTVCLAGCYRDVNTGVIEIKIQSYEVLTSANLGVPQLTSRTVQLAGNDNVRCVAGCAPVVTLPASGRAEIVKGPDTGAIRVTAVDLHRRHRTVSRFVMTRGSSQRHSGLSRTARAAVRS